MIGLAFLWIVYLWFPSLQESYRALHGFRSAKLVGMRTRGLEINHTCDVIGLIGQPSIAPSTDLS